MRRVTVAACAALCLMGTSSLALAEEGAKYGDQMQTGKLTENASVLGINDKPVRADDATKREPVQGYDATKDKTVPQRTYSGEGAKYGDQMQTGKLSHEPSVLGINDEPVRADDAMKSTEKEHKKKLTTHNDAAKAALSVPAPATKP